MKKHIILSLACLLSMLAFIQVDAFSDLDGSGASTIFQDAKIKPYVQVGFTFLGSNINVPVEGESPVAGLLQVGQIDLSMQDANFWTGIVGATVTLKKIFTVFGSAGGCLNRQFIVSGIVPLSLGQVTGQPVIDFDTSNLNMWFAQGGIGLGPILLGLYGDHFAVQVGDPRRGSEPLANQTLRGDVLTSTLAPYVGFALPAGGGLFTVIYSPLALSDMTLVIRTSQSDLAQAKYTWNKPGNLLSCGFEYNTEFPTGWYTGVWANYSYMWLRGEAQLDFQDSTVGYSRQREVTASMTKNALQLGITAGLSF